jgi:hypothetical protein
MLKPSQLWSRPGLLTPSLVGVRPNSPPQTSSVSVPGRLDVAAAGVKLHEPHPLLDQPAGDQALAPEVSGQRIIQAVHVERRLIFSP